MDTIKEPTTHNEKFMISKEELEELYCVNKMTQLEIANKFSVSRITVGKLFRNYNIESRRSRKKNYSFLEHDNSEIAFALGFIYGNSYFGTHPNNKQKPFIKIYSSKLFWINKIKKIIKTDYKIGHRLPKIYNGRKINEIYWIHIENPKVIDELNRIGINKEKHLTFDINILNEISFLNFIRGYL